MKLREAAREALEVLNLSDPKGIRAERIHAPEDAEIFQLCERIGYGAVMDSAARQWRRKDPIGAHTTGAAVATVQRTVKMLTDALKSKRGKE